MIPAQPAEPPAASPEAPDLRWSIEPNLEPVVWGDQDAEALQAELAKAIAADPPIEEPAEAEPQAIPNPREPEEPRDGQVETGTDDQGSKTEEPSAPEIEESQWLDLTLAEADAILIRLHKEAKAAPGDSELAAALYEPQAWNAGATVWHERKYAVNPQQAARASAAQAKHCLTLEALLGKDAKTYEQSLRRLAEALRLRLRAKAALETEATLEAKASDLAEALERMSKQVAVALIRNKTRVVEIDPPPRRTKGNPSPPILRAMAKQDFFDLYANDRYPVGDDQVSVAKVWFASEGRRTYKKGIGFDPSHIGTRPGAEVLNLFWGFAYEPLPADPSIDPYAGEGWSILRAHMLDNMASGDLKGFKYVLHWYADIRQNPADKKGTALVFRGPQGAGKSIISEIFGPLFGAHDHYVSKTDGVTGSFNEALFGRLHVTVEEAVWASDRVAEGSVGGPEDQLAHQHQSERDRGVQRSQSRPLGHHQQSQADHPLRRRDDRRDTVFS